MGKSMPTCKYVINMMERIMSDADPQSKNVVRAFQITYNLLSFTSEDC